MMDPLHARVDALIDELRARHATQPLDPGEVAATLTSTPLPVLHVARALTHVFGMLPPVALHVATAARP